MCDSGVNVCGRRGWGVGEMQDVCGERIDKCFPTASQWHILCQGLREQNANEVDLSILTFTSV